MPENRQTIRRRVRLIVGQAIDFTIDEAIREYHKTLQRKHSYRFMDEVATIDVKAGDGTFVLPDNFKEPINPMIGNTSGFVRMDRVLKNVIDYYDSRYDGIPAGYRIFNGQGHFYPRAETDFSFQLEYVRWFPDILTDDNPKGAAGLFLDEVYKAIEYFAIAEGLRRLRQYQAADYYHSKAENKRNELELDDVQYGIAAADLRMQMEG